MYALQRVLKGRAVVFLEDVEAYLDNTVGPNTQHQSVESSVMDGAHGQTVGNDGLTTV